MDRLLGAFAATFRKVPYLHRRPYTGDTIAAHLYEDLVTLRRSTELASRVHAAEVVVNTSNVIKGREGRRGDGTLGVLTPGVPPAEEEGFAVKRGPIATLQIGAEVKIIATKMTAQIDRVMNDLVKQADVFRTQSSKAITVGIVGVNFADEYTGYEGARTHDAKTPPSREAPEIVRRLDQFVRSHFEEFLILKFRATNRPPFDFSWVNERETRHEYANALVRIAEEYDSRF